MMVSRWGCARWQMTRHDRNAHLPACLTSPTMTCLVLILSVPKSVLPFLFSSCLRVCVSASGPLVDSSHSDCNAVALTALLPPHPPTYGFPIGWLCAYVCIHSKSHRVYKGTVFSIHNNNNCCHTLQAALIRSMAALLWLMLPFRHYQHTNTLKEQKATVKSKRHWSARHRCPRPTKRNRPVSAADKLSAKFVPSLRIGFQVEPTQERIPSGTVSIEQERMRPGRLIFAANSIRAYRGCPELCLNSLYQLANRVICSSNLKAAQVNLIHTHIHCTPSSSKLVEQLSKKRQAHTHLLIDQQLCSN